MLAKLGLLGRGEFREGMLMLPYLFNIKWISGINYKVLGIISHMQIK